MAIDAKPGQTVRVTISKNINREGARKTLERLFMKDKAISGPIELRSRNFIPLPKRRGGCIWTKYPNKLHAVLDPRRGRERQDHTAIASGSGKRGRVH